MDSKSKIQEWSAKRVDHNGDEYQIDSIFNEVRFIRGGDYAGQYRIGHNAVEVNQKCGHVTVVTDEYLDGDDRDSTIRELGNTLCTKCYNERLNRKLDENENASHLMNPGELNAL